MNNYPDHHMLSSLSSDYIITKVGSVEIDRFIEVCETPNGLVDVITYKLPGSEEIITEISCPRSESD